MGLQLDRRIGEEVVIGCCDGSTIHATVKSVTFTGDKPLVQLDFKAPREVKIDRAEVYYERNRKKNEEAGAGTHAASPPNTG
jgi:sRNA-binding carbon storage regulator CsrA